MKPARQAVGYFRVSSEDQKKGISLEMQPEKIRQYAALYEYQLREPLYHDDGISGRHMNKRPQLKLVIEHACDEKAALIVYALARLIRNTEEGLALFRRLRDAGAVICSISEHIDTTTAFGRFILRERLSIDELEIDQVSERTSACLATCKTNGRLTGQEPYGQLRDMSKPEINRKTKQTYYPHLIENPAEQPILTRILESAAKPGMTPGMIAQELNKTEVPTRDGTLWTRHRVRRILETHRKP